MRTKKECVFPGGKERSIYSQLLIWQMSNPGLSSHRVSFFFLLYFAWPSSQDSLCTEREPRPTPAAPGLALPDNPEGRTGTPDQLARAFSMEYENRVS